MARAKTKTVNLYEAKTHLSKLIDEASAGSEITIAKAGKPKARLVPLEKPLDRSGVHGRLGGADLLIADDFDRRSTAAAACGFSR